jgi:hypothetical protein
VRGQQAARLAVEEEPRALAPGQRLAVDGDAIRERDVTRGRDDDLAVDRNASRGDPRFSFTP